MVDLRRGKVDTEGRPRPPVEHEGTSDGMWKQRNAAEATYSPATASPAKSRQAAWSLAVAGAGGEQGWRLWVVATAAERTAGDTAGAVVELLTGEGQALPPLTDSYLRGDDFVTSFAARPADPCGLSVQVRPVACGEAEAVVELTLAIQTERLDSHPSIRVNIPSENGDAWEDSRDLGAGTLGPRRLSGGSGPPLFASLLLAARDRPAARDQSDAQRLQVALFGSFLEKGVIRKSRPWLVFRSDRPSTAEELAAWHERLCRSPLPLTP